MQTRTFVVGVDATAEGEAAIGWTRAALGPADTIVAVHVWDVPSMVGLDDAAMIPAEEMGAVAERGLAEFVERLDDARVTPAIAQGHAGRALLRVADEHDADAIAVGHQGAGRASFVLGSTANHVVNRTERPVVVVRGERVVAPTHIVVGVADHDASVRALRFAATNWPAARLEVVHAGSIDVARQVVDRAELADGADVQVLSVDGEPTETLIEASSRAELVVVGSRGRRPLAGLLLGSTSQALLSGAHCPVAVIR